MMKKLLPLLLCVLLLLGMSAMAYAAPARIVDDAGLLTDSERSALEEKAASLWDSCRLDVVVVTVDTTYGKSVQTYADDYYDEQGYGYGADNSGILLLLCMDTGNGTYPPAVKRFIYSRTSVLSRWVKPCCRIFPMANTSMPLQLGWI